MGHEDYVRQDKVVSSSNRAFGLVFASVFALIGCLPLLFGRPLKPWAVATSGIFLLAALLLPAALAPLNRLWTKLGLLLHHIISPVALAIVFFVAIAPMGLLMRMFGKDPLRLRFDPNATTYWIDREPPGPPPQSLRDQF